VPARQLDHLRNLSLGHLERIDAADANSVTVNVKHDLHGFLARLGEESLEHMHHEFHRRVVVVEDQHPVKRRLLGLRARLGDDPGGDAAAVVGRDCLR